jgi:hypothetical protein
VVIEIANSIIIINLYITIARYRNNYFKSEIIINLFSNYMNILPKLLKIPFNSLLGIKLIDL